VTRTSGPRRFGYLVDETEATPKHNGDDIDRAYARDVLGLFFQHGHLSDSDPRVIALAREHDRSPGSVSMVSGQFLSLYTEGAHGVENTSPMVREVWEATRS
jgi:hypothetical protein